MKSECEKAIARVFAKGPFHSFCPKADKVNKSSDCKTLRKKPCRLMMDALHLVENKANRPAAVIGRRKMKLHARLDRPIESPGCDKDVNRLVKRLIRHRKALFTFLKDNAFSPATITRSAI